MTRISSFLPPHTQQKLKLFFALSRTPHGLIDMAAPAAAALLCLGHFPSLAVTIVGLITVFAGYTAVYALNDLVDLKVDKQKVGMGGYSDDDNHLDGALMRHPMAKGALSLSSGLAWTFGWMAIALMGAYWLNPFCLVIFLAGCLLEALYCLLLRVTPMRALINGVVKTLGPIAAVYAVNPSPSIGFLTVLFLWIFFWEIGGQNIPCDWIDIQEDSSFKAKTIPVQMGTQQAGFISLLTLAGATIFQFILFWASPMAFNAPFLLGALAINTYLLIWPVLRLAEHQKRKYAITLFNKSSHYPLATLVLVLVRLAI